VKMSTLLGFVKWLYENTWEKQCFSISKINFSLKLVIFTGPPFRGWPRSQSRNFSKVGPAHL
jgi:hypothetical protein